MTSGAMPVADALSVLIGLRPPESVLITHQGSAREWQKFDSSSLDFHYIPSAMGEAVSLGLGLALAQPRREVWVMTGDGSLLMNLGCLVSVAAADARNLTVFVLDNGVYEVIGGQKTAGVVAGADYAAFARASGIRSVAEFDELDAWRQGAAAALERPGPRVITLSLAPEFGDYLLDPPCPIVEQVDRLRAALGDSG